MEKLFESSCKISPFDDIVVTRDEQGYTFTINSYSYNEEEGVCKITYSQSVTLCKPQTVKALMAILGDVMIYQGEIEKIED